MAALPKGNMIESDKDFLHSKASQEVSIIQNGHPEDNNTLRCDNR